MEVYKLLVPHNEYLAGMVGIYDDEFDDKVSLIMECKDGIQHTILIDSELVEETDFARIDCDTGSIIFEGWVIGGAETYGHESTVLHICKENGYKTLQEAYDDGFCYWTVWGHYHTNEVLGEIINYKLVEA